MSYEIEKNFYKYDEDKIKKIINLENVKYNIHLLKTYKFKFDNMMVRVRDEGFRKTFTMKKKNKNNVYNVEYQVFISDIHEMLKMLKLLGHENFKYQEKIREIYFFNEAEVCFDYIPGQMNFLQIESNDKTKLIEVINRLKLNNNKFNKYDKYEVMKEFGINEDKMKDIEYTFDNIKKIQNLVTKNKLKFVKMIKKQEEMYKLLKI